MSRKSSRQRCRSRRMRIEKLDPRVVLSATPIANPDILSTETDQVTTIDYLLLNDTDADGDALSISGTTNPTNGALVDHGDGTFTYTPNVGFAGSDSFSYTVTDSVDGSATAEISITVNAPFDVEAARDQILAGVAVLADPNGPGRMVAYGPNAQSISNYPGSGVDNPVLVAATMGQGRVIAMPDHQWLNMNTYGGDTSMSALYQNGIAWLGDSVSKDLAIVTYNRQANADWLTIQGFTNVVNANSASLSADLVGADVFVAGWLGSNPSDAVLMTIGDFVKDGGGLFITEYGIGYQWWWNKATEDIPANRLLRDAGIAFTKEWPAGGAQAINRAVGQVAANDVLAMLQDSSGATQTEKDIAASVYGKLNGVLANDDSLQARLDVEFWNRINTINPTPSSPVSDSFDQAMLRREMDLIKDLPPAEVTGHRTADAVYGAVLPAAPRLNNHTVTINTNKTGLLATGMYVAPGELVTLNFPPSLVGQGYTIRVNGHVDSITSRGSWRRVPYGVSRTFGIDSASVDISNAFGGAIYIDVGGGAANTGISAPGLGEVNLSVDGAVEAPLFVLGQTTNADWIATIRNLPGAYAEFVSDNLAFSVPSSWIRTLDNPTQLMNYWNDAVAFQDFVGGFETLRTGPDRINLDVQISVGLLHAGYPIQGPTSYGNRIVQYDVLADKGDWGWFHELGHERQKHPELGWGYDNPWTFSGDVEVTVNIGANAALEQRAPDPGPAGWGYSAYPNLVMARALNTINDASKPNFDGKDPYPFYFQLADGQWGWQGYRDVLSSYVDDQQNNPNALPQNNQEEKDQWMIRWSQLTGFDMTEYMAGYWKLEVTQSARDAVAALNLPGWMPLASSLRSVSVISGTSQTLDLAGVGMSIDGTATLVSVGAVTRGVLTNNGDGTYSYMPNVGFEGTDSFDVTFQSSAGNQQTFSVDLTVSSQGALLETFHGISGTSIASLTGSPNYPDSPSTTTILDSFEASTNAGSNFGNRVRAYLTVPVSGDYTFWIASDDNGELRLSTSTDPANTSVIASVPNYTDSRQWTKYSQQESAPISLLAGQKYYIEALMKEAGGGDNLAVAWSGPTISGPTVIVGEYLTVFGVEVNLTPVANDDSAVVDQDRSVVIGVLGNDYDPNAGDTLAIDSFTQGSQGAVTDNGDGSVTYTPAVGYFGADSFSYTINDGNGETATALVSLVISESLDVTKEVIDVQITQSSDDAEERHSNGSLDLTSSDIELGNDPSFNGNQTEGLRFQNLNIPQGATITSAYLSFTAKGSDSGATVLTIRATDVNDAATFANTTNNLTGRPTTATTVNWSPASWANDHTYQSPDVSQLVQEVVIRGGWSPGNSLAFVIDGTGSRNSRSFDDVASKSARLHIEYALDLSPVVNAMYVNGSESNLNRSGIGSLAFDFDQAVTVASATSLVLKNQTTGQTVDLSSASLLGNGTDSVVWDLALVSLADGRYTAELPATEAVNSLNLPVASTRSIKFIKLSGDLNGDGRVNAFDFGQIGANFDPIATASFRTGDANGDGRVNSADFGIIGAQFNPIGLASLPLDFGDANESGTHFATTLANDGARHVTSGPTLGTQVDSENDGQPSAGSDGDGADEDGVPALELQIGSTENLNLNATVPGTAFLNAWVDFNQDGDWDDAGEQIFNDQPLVDGANALTFAVPPSALAGNATTRFRLTSVAGYSHDGLAADGEVEDIVFSLASGASSPPVTSPSVSAESNVISLESTSTEPIEFTAYQQRLYDRLLARFTRRIDASRSPQRVRDSILRRLERASNRLVETSNQQDVRDDDRRVQRRLSRARVFDTLISQLQSSSAS